MTKLVMRITNMSPIVTTGAETLFQTLRKPKPLPTEWRLFQPVNNPFNLALLRRLTLR
jgi:hypothetical protein